MNNEESEILLLKDSQWNIIDGELCRVIGFIPLVGWVEDGKVISVDNKTPYASVLLENKNCPEPVKGFITNKIDFDNLWSAFRIRGVGEYEEVLIIWSNISYKFKIFKFFSVFLPKLRVIICPKGFWITTDFSWDRELLDFRLNENKIIEWKPVIIK